MHGKFTYATAVITGAWGFHSVVDGRGFDQFRDGNIVFAASQTFPIMAF